MPARQAQQTLHRSQAPNACDFSNRGDQAGTGDGGRRLLGLGRCRFCGASVEDGRSYCSRACWREHCDSRSARQLVLWAAPAAAAPPASVRCFNVETLLLGRSALLGAILEACGRAKLGWAVEREQNRDQTHWTSRGGDLRLRKLLRSKTLGVAFAGYPPKTTDGGDR